MDISCDIIRDILPLYAEELVSEATVRLVDDHLCHCDGCTKQLGILKKAALLPVELDTGGLKRVEKTIRRRKVLAVAAALLTVFTVLFSLLGWLNVTVYLKPEDAVIAVEAQEDGSLLFTTYDYVMGHSSFGWHQAEYENECYAHTWNTTRLDRLLARWRAWRKEPEEVRYYEDRNSWKRAEGWTAPGIVPESARETIPMEDCQHWYLDPYTGTFLQKLWGDDDGIAPEWDMVGSSHLRRNFQLALILTALLAACSRIPGKTWVKELLTRLAVLGGCVVFSQLFLTGGKFVCVYVSDEPFRTLRLIYSISVLLTLSILTWRQLCRMNRQDRGL